MSETHSILALDDDTTEDELLPVISDSHAYPDEPETTSSIQPPTPPRQCYTNCGVPSSCNICPRCHTLPCFSCCRRYLPPTCFPDPQHPLCQACSNKQQKPHQVRASTRNIVTEVSIPPVHGIHSFDSFIHQNAGVIGDIVAYYQRHYRSIRVHFRLDALFTLNIDDEQQQRVPANFSTPVQDIDMANPLNLDTYFIANLCSQVEH